ncbi:MAG: GNAT family N-acetyltransferase [Bacteroidota bacterium]
MHIYNKPFETLTTTELYELLQLRSEVFVVEQDCVCQDIDGKDQKAQHVLGRRDGKIVACTRIFDAGHYFKHASIGRIVVSKAFRGYGYGHDIVNASIQAIHAIFEKEIIEMSAQKYLITFYEVHGFKQTGKSYLEDGIPHVRMLRA